MLFFGRRLVFLTLFIFFLATSMALAGGELERPDGRVVLEVAGKIERTNINGEAHFDAKMLAQLPQQVIRTSTLWTDGVGTFSGPRILDLLRFVGAQKGQLQLIALNDYRIDIPFADLQDYPVILATSLDGKALRVRSKGPVWVIYPWDTFPELNSETYYVRSVWQLHRIVVE